MKMFRLLLVLVLVFVLGSFGSSQNQSVNKTPVKAGNCCGNVSSFGHCRDGKDGRDGRDGRSGAKGEQGNPGLRGSDGNNGLKGPKGDLGMPGQKGMPGTCDAKILSRINSLDKELKKIQNESKQNSSNTSSKPAICASECHGSTGFHFFEKVQDLPTKGVVAVKHFKIGGNLFLAFASYHGDIHKHKTTSVIYKMEDSTGRFTPYQTLQTRGAYDLEYFSIADKHFLAVANRYDGTQQLDSVIYQWNGTRFVDFQNIPTNAGSHFTFFTIEGEKYLAVTNYYDGSTWSKKSVIYKWKNGKFDKFQEIATEGAMGCTVFVINNNTFIAFANRYNSQQKFSVHSSVFKWSGGHFVKIQTLQTYGARSVKYFKISGHTFLAFANRYSGSKNNINSFIYKWDGNKFTLFQSIPTRGAAACHSFVISGQTYLGVANNYGDSQKYNTLSVVYQASGAQFAKYQEIPTHGALDMTSFEYKGHTYLAVANYYNGQHHNINSALYKWV